MLQMFGFGGIKCVRCGHRNAAGAQYCAQCGMVAGAPRSEPVLVENRWVPGPDELAVFFGVRELSGVFVKTLRVPATTRAYILQGEKATEVPQGEYEIEGFFTRLNHLLRDQHAEILITRTSALPVHFELHDLPSAEHLKLSASLTVSVQIEQVAAFARHFMTMPGVVTTGQLRDLLTPSVRQVAAEFTAAQSLRDMVVNRELRHQFDERLQGALKMRLAQFGLAAVAIETLSLRHDRFDANRERVGSLWLLADERSIELQHARQLDELYSDEEWQRIWREEQQSRQRIKREELRQSEGMDKAELTLGFAERMHALRAREIELYGRIAESRSRKEALGRGAAEIVAELEHELAAKGRARQDEAAQWEHVRKLAQVRLHTELEVAQQEAQEQRALAQQRFSHQLLLQQIHNKIEQARLIEDEAGKRDALARLRRSEQVAAERAREIEDEQHKAALQSLVLARAARQREAERSAAWEQAVGLDRQQDLARVGGLKDAEARLGQEQISQRIAALQRSGGQQDAIAQHEKLLRTIEADGIHARQTQRLELERQEAQWQQELRRLELEREERFAGLNHATELARIEIARAESLGALSDTAKLALAAAPNAAALADYLKTQVHANMSADQLAALSSVVAAGHGMTAEQGRAQLERERQARDLQLDAERRHQIELLRTAQGGQVHHHHAAPTLRRCPNGHPVDASDRFCAACGAALTH